MPKNKGKGGKNCRRGKNDHKAERRELILKEDGQEYAQVIKMLGSCRLEAMCFDGVKRLCHIRGKLHKKAWISQGDIILLGLRDYQDTKADIILKYTDSEARDLKEYGEFPDSINLNETVSFVDEGLDDEVEFGYENVEEELDNKLVLVGLKPDKISATADVNKIIEKLGVNISKEHIKVRVIPTKAPSDPVEVSFTSEEARNSVLGKQGRTRVIDSEETGLSGEKRNIYINEKMSKDTYLTFNRTRDLRTLGYKSIWHEDNQVFCKKSNNTETIKVTSYNQIEALQWDNKI